MNTEQKAKAYDEALERARRIKNGEDNWGYCDLTEIIPALEEIFPELRESEDERTRKELIFFLKEEIPQCSIKEHADKLKKFVAYLEKQKEQKHPNGCFTCDEYKKGYEEGRRNGFTAGYNKAIKEVEQKEQNPVDSNDMINAILSALASGLETDEILKARGFTYDEVEKWLDSTRNPAIEYIRGQNKIFENPEKYGLQRKQKPNYCHHEVDETGWTEEYRKAYYDGWNNCNMQHEQAKAEQKPAEWNEEDEVLRQDCIRFIETGWTDNGKSHLIPWLKSLHLQPKKEWSKRDKKILQSLHHVMNCADAQNAVKRDGLSVEDVCSFLFSIEPQWKPSEEQMDALMNGLRILPEGENNDILLSLYNDLKNL